MTAAAKAEALLPLVYAAATDAEVWPTLLQQLAVELDADGLLVGHLPTLPPASGRIWAHGVAPAAVGAFMCKAVIDAAQFAEGIFALAPAPCGAAPASSGAAGPALCRGLSIALRPSRPLPEPVGRLWRQPGCAWALAGFQRPGPAAREVGRRQLLEALLPHLQRAARLQARVARLQQDALLLATTLERLSLGVLALAADLEVVFANAVAEQVLGGGDGLRLADGRLSLREPALQRRLRAAVEAAAAGEADGAAVHFFVGRPSGAPPLTLCLEPVGTGRLAGERLPGAVAALFVTDPARPAALPSPELLAERFGLTASEAAVARLAAMGRGMPFVADALGLSLNTVRTHLKAVYGKTAVNHQAGLARLLVETFPPFAAESAASGALQSTSAGPLAVTSRSRIRPSARR